MLAGLAASATGVLAACGEPPPLVRRCTIGAWAAGPGDLAANHVRLEERLGARLPLVSWYADWDTPWEGALADAAAALARRGEYEVMISWEPVGVRFAEILDRRQDAYLSEFLDGVRRHPGRVLLRPFAEMNGPWQAWSVEGEQGLVQDAATWTAAWRHLVDLGRRRGAGVSFVFCVNTTDEGQIPMEEYWPGPEWVDAVGIDGYNWDFAPDGQPLVGPEQVLGPMYDRLTVLDPDLPVIACEIGCAAGDAKAAWFEALYTSRRFPRLTRLALFHERKERDWRLDSDPATLAVHRRYLRERPIGTARSVRRPARRAQ